MQNQSHIILYNKRCEIYLQYRDDKGKNPNTIGLFGGSSTSIDEIPYDAVCREFKEETGYILKSPILLDKYPIDKSDGENYIFYEEYDNKTKLNCFEGRKGEWLTKGAIKKYEIILDGDKNILKDFYCHIKNRGNHAIRKSH